MSNETVKINESSVRVATDRGSFAKCDCGYRGAKGLKRDALYDVDAHRATHGLAPLFRKS